MIASVETDVFALDLAPAAKLGRDSLFLSPAYAIFCPPASKSLQKSWPLKNFGAPHHLLRLNALPTVRFVVFRR